MTMKKIVFTLLLLCIFCLIFTQSITAYTQGTNAEVLTIPKKLKVFCKNIDENQVKKDINQLKDKSDIEVNIYLNNLANTCRKDDINEYFKNQDNPKAYEVVFEFLNIIAPLQRNTNTDLLSAKSLLDIITYPLGLSEFVQPNNWLCLPNLTGVTLLNQIQLDNQIVDLECKHPFSEFFNFNDVGKYLFLYIFPLWLIIMMAVLIVKIMFNFQKRNPEPTLRVFLQNIQPLIEKVGMSLLMSGMFIILFNGYNIGSKILIHYIDKENTSFCNTQSNIRCLATTLVQVEQRKLLVNTQANDLPSISRKSKGLWGIFPEFNSPDITKRVESMITWFKFLILYSFIAIVLLYITVFFMFIQFYTWLKLVIQFGANQIILYTRGNPTLNFKETIYLFRTSFIQLIGVISFISITIYCFSRFNIYTVGTGLIVTAIILMLKGAELFDYILIHIGLDKNMKNQIQTQFDKMKSNSFKPISFAKNTVDIAKDNIKDTKEYIDVNITQPIKKLNNLKNNSIQFTQKIIPKNISSNISNQYKKTSEFIKNKTKK